MLLFHQSIDLPFQLLRSRIPDLLRFAVFAKSIAFSFTLLLLVHVFNRIFELIMLIQDRDVLLVKAAIVWHMFLTQNVAKCEHEFGRYLWNGYKINSFSKSFDRREVSSVPCMQIIR